MKPRSISIGKRLLTVILVLALLPCLAMAQDQASLDRQLAEAAEKGNLSQVKALLAKGADVNSKDRNGWAPLMGTVWRKHPAVAKLLIEKGADVNAKGPDGSTALIEAADQGSLELAQLLLNKGADVNAANRDGWTPLMRAAGEGNLDVVKLLLDKGASVNQADEIGSTALMSAAYNGPEVIRLLIERGARVNAVDKKGLTALALAVAEGKLKNIALLIENGADVDAVTSSGSTALMIAASLGKLDTAKLLIEKGANVNARDEIGRTPLMMGAKNGNLELVKLLAENGADLNAVSKNKRTALGIAEAYGQTDVFRYLREHGSDQAKGAAEKEALEYPSTPKGVVEAFVKEALSDLPIAVEEMRSCWDLLRFQYRYLPKDEDKKANREPHWGPLVREWHVVTGFEIKDVKEHENRATAVKVLFRRLGWFDFDPFRFEPTNDVQEVTYDLAKRGKFWRIVNRYEPYISVSSAIKCLECQITESCSLMRDYPSAEQKMKIRHAIKILEQDLSR